jgi:hypothetical protein
MSLKLSVESMLITDDPSEYDEVWDETGQDGALSGGHYYLGKTPL